MRKSLGWLRFLSWMVVLVIEVKKTMRNRFGNKDNEFYLEHSDLEGLTGHPVTSCQSLDIWVWTSVERVCIKKTRIWKRGPYIDWEEWTSDSGP